MSIWTLSADARRDVETLYQRIRLSSLVAGAEGTDALIQQLVNRNEPAAIPVVASYLFSSNNEVREVSAKVLALLLDSVRSKDLIRLGELLGGYYHEYMADRWSKIKPSEVESHLSKTADIALGGLLSLHSNGYVRQAAVRFLASVDTGQELRFLLLRQNDWVNSVAQESKEIVLAKLSPKYLGHFIDETGLLFHLLKCERRDMSEVVSKYVDLLILSEHAQQLQRAIDSVSRESGRAFVDYLLSRDGGHLARVVRSGIAATGVIMRANCLQQASDCLPKEECVEIADRLICDKFIGVRQEAYELKAKLSPDSSNSVWKQCLFDKSRSLRETGMFYLRKANCDVAPLYRERLIDNPNSLPGLSGLVASGDSSDLDTFVNYLESPLASRRAEAIRGVGRVGSEADVLRLQKLLLDESPRVVRATFQELQPIAKLIDSDALFGLIENCKTVVGQKAILQLLMEKGRWVSLKYLVESLASPDESLARCSKKLLNEMFSLTRVFTQPSQEQRKQIQQTLDRSQDSIEVVFLSEIKSFLAGFGFKFSVR